MRETLSRGKHSGKHKTNAGDEKSDGGATVCLTSGVVVRPDQRPSQAPAV
jgi:hypothetical protein